MPKQTCLKIPKADGQKIITLAHKLDIVNREHEIQRNESFIYVPLRHQPEERELIQLRKKSPTLECSKLVFPEKRKKMTIQEMLADQLPPNLLANIPHAFDFVGDIAIVEIPKELEPYSAVIGEAILKTHRNIKTVLAKAGAVSGVFRLRGFKLIAGESKTETVQKEFGCQYYVDVAKAYFSPRLSHEHKRIALLVRENETVLDLFAGVGPFSILIAKTHKNVNVYAVDVNPSAIDHLKKNVRLNRVIEKVYPVLGDARRVVKEKFSHIADRVIMNLPETASEFVDVACQALKTDGGMIHFYSFTSDSDMVENVQRVFVQKVEASGRRVEAVQFKFVRETAPHEHQLVLDALVR